MEAVVWSPATKKSSIEVQGLTKCAAQTTNLISMGWQPKLPGRPLGVDDENIHNTIKDIK
jgi:hypothetical protein